MLSNRSPCWSTFNPQHPRKTNDSHNHDMRDQKLNVGKRKRVCRRRAGMGICFSAGKRRGFFLVCEFRPAGTNRDSVCRL